MRTARLVLVPATVEIERAAADGSESLSRALSARVPSEWPPRLVERVLGYWADKLAARPDLYGWTAWYWLCDHVLIGYGGFKGRPQADGEVEIGYGVLASWRRNGYATEATGALVDWALRHDEVQRVVAHTLPRLVASVGVLERLGFRQVGPGKEQGSVRYERPRA